MSEFIQICTIGDIPATGALHVEVDGEPIAIVLAEGEVFAIRDVCSHADVRLSEGEVIDCTIECWLHGSQFDLRTGAALTMPAITPVPVYPVRLIGEGPQAVVEVSRTPMPVNENEGTTR